MVRLIPAVRRFCDKNVELNTRSKRKRQNYLFPLKLCFSLFDIFHVTSESDAILILSQVSSVISSKIGKFIKIYVVTVCVFNLHS